MTGAHTKHRQVDGLFRARIFDMDLCMACKAIHGLHSKEGMLVLLARTAAVSAVGTRLRDRPVTLEVELICRR